MSAENVRLEQRTAVLAALAAQISHIEDNYNIVFSVDIRNGYEPEDAAPVLHYDGTGFSDGPTHEVKS